MNLGVVRILGNRRNALDVVIFVSIRVFTLIFIESDCVLLYFVNTLDKNTLHTQTTVSYLAM